MKTAIRDIRRQRGMTQIDLAIASGVAQPTISLLENGGENATLTTMLKIAEALSVPVANLFDDENDAPTAKDLLKKFLLLSEDEQALLVNTADALLAGRRV